MKLAPLAATLLVAGCVDRAVLPAEQSKTLDPIAFFTGASRGVGALDKLIGDNVPIRVSSSGRPDGRGGLILDQIIWEGEKRPRHRRWAMRTAGPRRLVGSLTDARGPVNIVLDGPRATIRYTMDNGMQVHQHLALQRGGRTLRNRLTVTRLGIRLAQLDETIRKLD